MLFKINKINFNNNGFTLNEIMMVLVVVGILAALALPKMSNVIESSRASEGEATLREIFAAQKRYYIDHNQTYASNLSALDVTFPVHSNFQNPSVSSSSSNNFTATITRSGAYTLTITESGTITCTDGSGPSMCGKIGY